VEEPPEEEENDTESDLVDEEGEDSLDEDDID